MAQEIYHRSNWGNPTETWGNTYLNADLTNELYKRASEYENSWVTDQLLNGVGTKPSIILTPTAYEDGILNSVKPKGGENLVPYSEDFSQWNKSDATITSSGFTAPDGTQNASILTTSASGGTVQDNLTVSNGNVTFSVFVKKGTTNGVRLRIDAATDSNGYFDLVNNTVYSSTNDAKIENYGSGWYRVSISDNITSFVKASIYTTDGTTSYDNGTLHIWGAQVERGSEATEYIKTEGTAYKNGDFNFTRGSSATRVNELGLVSDVQILSGELVQNGDFEQIGSELVTNGGFDTDSDWTKGLGWSIANGKATVTNSTVGSIYQNVLDTSKIYKATFEITEITSGSLRIGIGINFSDYFTEVGTYTYYGKPTNDGLLRINPSSGTNASIDNVSVKEVGQNWTFGTGWSIEDSKVYFDNPTGTEFYQSLSTTAGKYRISFDLDITSGTIQTSFSSPSVSTTKSFTTSGTKTVDITTTASFSRFRFVGLGGSVFNIDNISVVEVTDDTDLPRINYTNFDYEDVLGDELVTNGTFDTDSNWSKDTGWTISNGEAIHTGSGSYISQTGTTIGKNYRVVIEVTQASGSGFPQIYMGGLTTAMTSVGTYTFDITATSTLIRLRGLNDCKVTSISVKELTEDVVVPYSGEGSLLLEPQSTNLVPYSEDLSQLSTVTSGGTVTETANFSEAPNGKNEATRLQMSSASGYALKGYTIPGFNDYFYVSVYLKSNTTENQEVAIYGRDSVNQSYTVTPQWQRFEVACDSRFNSSYFYFGVRTAYGSDADIDISAWGVQAEQGTYATSYIPTNGSTVTRLADVCNNSGNSDLINSTDGVLYAEISALSDDNTGRNLGISDGTTSNRILILYSPNSNELRFYIAGSGGSITINHNLSEVTDFIKVALKYKAQDFSFYVNGVEIDTNTSNITFSGLDDLSFNNPFGGGTSNFYGNVKCVAVFKEALSDTELEKLTTI